MIRKARQAAFRKRMSSVVKAEFLRHRKVIAVTQQRSALTGIASGSVHSKGRSADGREARSGHLPHADAISDCARRGEDGRVPEEGVRRRIVVRADAAA